MQPKCAFVLEGIWLKNPRLHFNIEETVEAIPEITVRTSRQ